LIAGHPWPGGKIRGGIPFRVVTGHGAFVMPFFRKVRFWAGPAATPGSRVTSAFSGDRPVRNIGTETGANDDLAMVQAGSLTQPGSRRVRSLESQRMRRPRI
jgi:hypothetical protein